MTLRKAQPTDASSIAALSIEVWLGTYLKRGINGFFADYALETFTAPNTLALIADTANHIIVSEACDGIDGFIRISHGNPAPVSNLADVEIATLYVQPRHHGKGIGTGLLHAALAHCRDRQVPSVWLATNAQNSPAIEFYRAQGFAAVGETDFRIDDQAYVNTVFVRRTEPSGPDPQIYPQDTAMISSSALILKLMRPVLKSIVTASPGRITLTGPKISTFSSAVASCPINVS